MLPGETTLSGANPQCCGKTLPFEICRSNAGYYIGTMCPNCGPYSRESGYYPSYEKADQARKAGTVAWRK